MKVVQLVCSHGFSGVEKYMVNLARGLEARGDECTMIGGHRTLVTAHLRGSSVRHLPGDTMAQALNSLRRVTKPDVVNSHMTEADVIAMLARLTSRFKVVSTLHFAHPRGQVRLSRLGGRFLSRSLDGQIAISDFVRRETGEPAEVIVSGVPALPPVHRERLHVVLVAQRLEVEKDTETVLRAWAGTNARHNGWRLRIAGHGGEEARLRRLTTDLGLESSVEFLGFCDDMPRIYESSALLVASAPREPLGLTVIEAMAAGLPILASAGGGHLETVGRVPGAELFQPGSAQDLARRIDRMVDDPQARAQYSRALSAYQREHLTLDRQVEQTSAYYRHSAD